jgi:nucleotide-binding universal stress UspA family protein
MNGFQRILVAVDFSDCAWGICERALTLARALRADVVLAHVVTLPGGVPRSARVRRDGGERSAVDVLRDAARQRLVGYEALFRDARVPVRSVLLEGPPADALLAGVEETGADLVVMGTHGRTGAARTLLGSVAEKVVRRSPQPVLTVRTLRTERCQATSCAWCRTHLQPEHEQLADEALG